MHIHAWLNGFYEVKAGTCINFTSTSQSCICLLNIFYVSSQVFGPELSEHLGIYMDLEDIERKNSRGDIIWGTINYLTRENKKKEKLSTHIE